MVFTATPWSRSVGNYALACKLILIEGGYTIWVEEHGEELERLVTDNWTAALYQAEAWFSDYQSLFYHQLIRARDRQ